MRFVGGSGSRLSEYAEGADYAEASSSRRSVSNVTVLLSDTAIGWKSSTQKCVTTATCEAECVALFDVSKQAFFTRAFFLMFLQPELGGLRVDIFVDQGSSKVVVDNTSSAMRNKKADVKLHSIRGLIHTGEVRTIYVETEDQHVDVLTNALWRNKNMVHRAALMNLS